MKKAIVILGVLALALPAMADLGSPRDHSNAPIFMASEVASGVPTNEPAGQRAGAAVYDSLGPGTAGYLAYPATVGPLGYDDYGTNSGVNLTAFKFVGGLTSIPLSQAGVMWFTWFTQSGAFATSAGVAFGPASSGFFTWTITFNSPPFVIPHNGIFQVTANSTFTGGGSYSTTSPGKFYLTSTDAVVVGSNSPAFGGTTGSSLVHAFSFHVPEPTTIGLLGAALLALVPRRR